MRPDHKQRKEVSSTLPYPNLPLLTAAEERELGRAIQSGSQKAKSEARIKLLLHNTKLVVSIATKFCGRNAKNPSERDENRKELTGEGMFGLLEAIDRFDPERGCRFSTYATYWIRRHVYKALNQGRMIRVPYYMHGILAKIPWAMSILATRFPTGDIPDDVMAETLRCTVSEYRRTLDITGSTNVYFLDTPSQEQEDSHLSTMFDALDYRERDPEEQMLHHETEDLVWKALERLSRPKAHILMLRYGFGAKKKYTLREIGSILGLSRERVRQLEHEGLDDFLIAFNEEKQWQDQRETHD